MKRLVFSSAFLLLLTFLSGHSIAQQSFDNFKIAVYVRSYEVQKMGDINWLDSIWSGIEAQLHVDKVYLETHRDLVMVQKDTLERVKKYFTDKGIQTAGGITYTVSEPNRFQTFCYSTPEDRQKVQEIIEYTAQHFDEIILDDFFFTNCKCERCIEAKGNLSWTDFRLQLMTKAAENLILAPARKVNPNVKVIIKYPNWYEHFQGLGFNLETEPPIFDGIYTGTETRDAFLSAQHLQPYHGYSIFRYFENIKPGGNLGGWVDTGASFYLDRYAEQLWLTLFAKAPEITLFDFRQLQRPLSQFITASWQGTGTSFDLNELEQHIVSDVSVTIAGVADYTLSKIDPIIGELGKPIGIKCYRPYHSVGEDFLPSYLGMIGLPIDIVPEFPSEEPTVLLTEDAAFDGDIVMKIKNSLLNGHTVIITSGLLKQIQSKGLDDIAEIRYTGNKMLVDNFVIDFKQIPTLQEVLIPQIRYLTNDAWDVISANRGATGCPLLLDAGYNKGKLYVLVVPENFIDLYDMPEAVLDRLRILLCGDQFAQLGGPGNISLFLYDNQTLIVESFRDETVTVNILANANATSLTDLQSGESISGSSEPARGGWSFAKIPEKKIFEFELKPHSFRVFQLIYSELESKLFPLHPISN